MVVLEGNQGQGKSTACRILAGDWYSDSMPGDGASKDAKAHLQGKWLIELAELHALNKSETTALKAFLTSATDKYRPTYGRNEVERPRQNVFIGTTNKQVYLKDETGSRRFWPVQTTDIKLDQLQADRDQLFAEAYEAFKAGEAWWPTREFERDYILQEQEERADRDIWEQSIMDYIAENNMAEVTIYELAKNVLFFDTSRMGTSDQRRITAILERNGWVRGKKHAKTKRQVFVPGGQK
jgi:predicted P-loop ATPase